MKAAFVTPRWGPQVVGGAEHALRGFAERLAADGWNCEALTTRARDHLTWANELPEGRTVETGVTVHRFGAVPSRRHEFTDLDARVLRDPASVWPGEAERWVDLQGPSSRDLVAAVADCDADVIVFSPYLYYPTVRGLPAARAATVLHPALHDEPVAGLPAFDAPFRAASAFAYYTHEERRAAEERFHVAARPSLVAGIGVDPPASDVGELPEALRGRPYVLSVGRVEAHKGSALLSRYFTLYKAQAPGPLALAFAGPVGEPAPPERDDVIVLGSVDEATKWALLRNAQALVSASPFESFSLVLMEAWSVGTPVLVNARCAVTTGHARRSRGGLWFDGYPMFRAALDCLTADDPAGIGPELGASGHRYVDAHFRWPSVLDRYRRFLEHVATDPGSRRSG